MSYPCEACGQACELPAGAEPVLVMALSRVGEPPRPADPRPALNAEFARCEDCRARSELAQRIIARFPVLSAKYGPWGATVRVENALAALVVLGMPLPDPETVPPQVVGSLVGRLGAISVAWSGEFAPVQRARPGSSPARPWSHVPKVTRDELREAYGAHLADRMAAGRPAQRVVSPDGSGCLYCGRGAVVRGAVEIAALGGVEAARGALWRRLSVEPSILGGRRVAQPVVGYVCEELCGAAIDSVGSVGLTSLERAFSRYLRSVGRHDDAQRVERGAVDGLVGWGPFAANARQRGHAVEPSREPFEHVRMGP